ncbi:MAG: L-threonine 3-dehydrogenase [Rhodospirillaceae bacterium]|nr:L-threonine 3-dehydrogenase [Rhodospirillaceae bacterium]
MKALVKQKREPGLWLEEVPAPPVGPEDVLIKVRRSSICGTDLHIYNWDDWAQRTIPVPMTVGHEFVGTVVEVGHEVHDLKVGDRVSGEGHITCGHCRNCRAGRQHLCRNTVGVGVNRPGAFAEYIAIPARNAYPIPPDLPDEVASVLDPLGNAAHTALSYDLIGEDVLITGAGPIGLMAAAIARHVGARHVVVTDVNPYRLALAERLGATPAVDARPPRLDAVMHELGMTEGFDVGLEMSGSPDALRQMIAAMYHGGGIALLGIPPAEVALDLNQVIFKGLRLKGIYGREMFETWYKMIAMLQSGLDITPVLTHRFPAAEFDKGFAAMNEGRSGKVVLDWE